MVRMMSLALNGITSFSMRSLRMIAVIGLTMAAISFLVGVWEISIVVFTKCPSRKFASH